MGMSETTENIIQEVEGLNQESQTGAGLNTPQAPSVSTEYLLEAAGDGAPQRLSSLNAACIGQFASMVAVDDMSLCTGEKKGFVDFAALLRLSADVALSPKTVSDYLNALQESAGEKDKVRIAAITGSSPLCMSSVSMDIWTSYTG